MKGLLVIWTCTSFWISYAESNEKLIDFFNELRNHDDIISKNVLVGSRVTSINDYFQVHSAKLIEVKKMKLITAENVNEVSKLLNIVISCEYISYIQYIITTLDEEIDKCFLAKKSSFLEKSKAYFRNDNISSKIDCYQNIYMDLCDPFLDHMTQMIRTLLGLQSLTKNVVSKKQDPLQI